MKKISPKQILIECKSTPRSGLHFLKNTLNDFLGKNFSFCERYNEPGCCKKFPCALLCFNDEAAKNQKPHLRLAKSHDFQLNDKKIKTSESKRLLILKRDPLYAITSWWELQEIVRHKEFLLRHHIDLKKILDLHEEPLIHRAIRLIDKNYIPPTENEFKAWLNKSSLYLLAFHERWVHIPQNKYTKVVDYDHVAKYAANLIQEIEPSLKNSRQLSNLSKSFTSRDDPFVVKSKAVTLFLQSHRALILSHLKKKNLIR